MPWLQEHVGDKSVTELEILHGVLRNEQMIGRAFFYFRDSGYIHTKWTEITKRDPRATPSDFVDTDDENRRKLLRLKQAIMRRSTDFVIVENYVTPENAGELILAHIWAAIDAEFPACDVPDGFDREALAHQVFRDSRIRAYVEREGLFDALDAHALGVGPQFRVVLGASGCGKSALLAAWLTRHENQVVFCHFVGGTVASASAESILRRLLETLLRRGVVPAGSLIPLSPTQMGELLPVWLAKLSEAGGGVILIDALNQLTTSEDRELWWWPKEWPVNVRLVLSTLQGDSLRAIERRGWLGEGYTITVPRLRVGEKAEIMRHYLRLFTKELKVQLKEQILAASQTDNPLFLRTVLEELRVRSRHETLEKNLEGLLRCEDPARLFVHILKNLERDFTPETHPGLIHRALGLMGTARRGLAESEILELLSPAATPETEPLPRRLWSPLYLALEDSLVSKDGQLHWFHDYLRQAVSLEYLDGPQKRHAAHRRLADPVVSWNKTIFGPGLRRYGFQHGIVHLLESGNLGEALQLTHNSAYRETATSALRDSGHWPNSRR